MNFRNIVDLTPWDDSGRSFNGLTRHQSKVLALFFIIIGLALADPPFSFLPTDFLNLFVAGELTHFFNITFNMALLLSYTLIAWSLFFIGIYIYPYNTTSLFNGYIHKLQNYIKRILRNPLAIIVGLTLFYFMYKTYAGWLA